MEEQILLIVEHTSPRLGVSVVGFQGGLCAGQSQWMGICLRPARKTLTNATLQVSQPESAAASPPPLVTSCIFVDTANPLVCRSG